MATILTQCIIFIALNQAAEVSKVVNCVDVEGGAPSGGTMKSIAVCSDSTHSITSCGAKPATTNFVESLGARLTNAGCTAYSELGGGTLAIARCCDLQDYYKSFSTVSGSAKIEHTSSCSTGETLIGCTTEAIGSATSGVLRGAYVGDVGDIGTTDTAFSTGDQCTAAISTGGSNVYAAAICYDSSTITDGWQLDCVSVWGAASSISTVACPVDKDNYFMTSCSAYHADTGIKSYQVIDDVCTANHESSGNLYANAVCCRLTKDDPSVTTTSTTTASTTTTTTEAPQTTTAITTTSTATSFSSTTVSSTSTSSSSTSSTTSTTSTTTSSSTKQEDTITTAEPSETSTTKKKNDDEDTQVSSGSSVTFDFATAQIIVSGALSCFICVCVLVLLERYISRKKREKRDAVMNNMMNESATNPRGESHEVGGDGVSATAHVMLPGKEWVHYFFNVMVQLPQYAQKFINQGYDNQDKVLSIGNKVELVSIGIDQEEHRQIIIAEINKVRHMAPGIREEEYGDGYQMTHESGGAVMAFSSPPTFVPGAGGQPQTFTVEKGAFGEESRTGTIVEEYADDMMDIDDGHVTAGYDEYSDKDEAVEEEVNEEDVNKKEQDVDENEEEEINENNKVEISQNEMGIENNDDDEMNGNYDEIIPENNNNEDQYITKLNYEYNENDNNADYEYYHDQEEEEIDL